jgi:hypothetical protein
VESSPILDFDDALQTIRAIKIEIDESDILGAIEKFKDSETHQIARSIIRNKLSPEIYNLLFISDPSFISKIDDLQQAKLKEEANRLDSTVRRKIETSLKRLEIVDKIERVPSKVKRGIEPNVYETNATVWRIKVPPSSPRSPTRFEEDAKIDVELALKRLHSYGYTIVTMDYIATEAGRPRSQVEDLAYSMAKNYGLRIGSETSRTFA